MAQGNMQEYLLTAASLAGMSGVLGGTLSLFYDWGYYATLGIGFELLPLSISDVANSTLSWLPTVIVCVLMFTAFELNTLVIERGLSEQEIFGRSQNPRRLARFRRSPFQFMV